MNSPLNVTFESSSNKEISIKPRTKKVIKAIVKTNVDVTAENSLPPTVEFEPPKEVKKMSPINSNLSPNIKKSNIDGPYWKRLSQTIEVEPLKEVKKEIPINLNLSPNAKKSNIDALLEKKLPQMVEVELLKEVKKLSPINSNLSPAARKSNIDAILEKRLPPNIEIEPLIEVNKLPPIKSNLLSSTKKPNVDSFFEKNISPIVEVDSKIKGKKLHSIKSNLPANAMLQKEPLHHSRSESSIKREMERKFKLKNKNELSPLSEFKDLSRRPTCTSFHQQTMQGWTPSFEPRFISRIFIAIAIIFLIIGCITIILTSSIEDLSFEYTHCKDLNGVTCADKINNKSYTDQYSYCQCNHSFTIRRVLKAPVYFYYTLGNYYQNHRVYLASRDDEQLHGDNVVSLDKACEPLRYEMSIEYAPCGLVANSRFNDTFLLLYIKVNESLPVTWSNNNIAWSSDKNVIFGRPSNWNKTVKPKNWKLTALQYNTRAYSGDEDFLVWMRAAPLDTFRKLHRIIHSSSYPFKSGLPKGNYTLIINYAYPVTKFYGSKSVYFSTTTFLGGKNNFISIVFLVVSAIHFILGMLLIYFEMYSDPRVMQHPIIAVSKAV